MLQKSHPPEMKVHGLKKKIPALLLFPTNAFSKIIFNFGTECLITNAICVHKQSCKTLKLMFKSGEEKR